jgi:ELWxxDGT repeat protein
MFNILQTLSLSILESGPCYPTPNSMKTLSKLQTKRLPKFLRLIVVLLSFATSTLVAQTRLVADLNQEPPNSEEIDGNAYYTVHKASSERSFFIGGPGVLYTSDGTMEGTVVVKKFLELGELEVMNGIAYFVAFTHENGYEMWRSDGTPAGTNLFHDIYPGPGSSRPTYLTIFNGLLYFSANNRVNGRELWRSDGTPSGTWMVADVEGGSAISSNVSKLTVAGSKLFFVANDGERGYELFVTDGSPGGTTFVRDIHPGSAHSSPGEITAVNNIVFFSAAAPAIDRQLWRSDGTPEGTYLVKVIRSGNRSAEIGKMVHVNGSAYFQATDGIHGIELWKSDGTEGGTMLLKDITPGPGSEAAYASDHIDYMTPALGKLFFVAHTPSGRHRIWISDGTEVGTHPIHETEISTSWSHPGLTEFMGSVYLVGYAEDFGHAVLFKIDATSSTSLANFGDEFHWNDPLFASFNGKLHFLFGDQYLATDGTDEGTTVVKSFEYASGSYPNKLTDVDGTLFFHGGQYPGGLWKSNGTAASTIKIGNLPYVDEAASLNGQLIFIHSDGLHSSNGEPGNIVTLSSAARHARQLRRANGLLFFSAYGPGTGEEVWQTDGTAAGTKLTKDIVPGEGHSGPRNLTALNNQIFFNTYDLTFGNELFRSDGTPEGTYLVKDINPGLATSFPVNYARFGNKMYFQANDGTHGYELWTSDGTDAGTYMIKDIQSDDLTVSDMGDMMSTSQYLFFSAQSGAASMGFWKSNGAASGTTKLVDFATNRPIELLASVGTNVFFVVYYGGYGTSDGYMELWKSNGTAAGTKKLRKLMSSYINPRVAVLGDVVYFTASFGLTGNATLWRTNGHYSGTYPVPFDGGASDLTTSGPYVYFNGSTVETGSELYVIDESGAAATAATAAVELNDRESIANYPNPFRSSFTLNVRGETDEKFAIAILTSTGQRIPSPNLLPCNTNHSLGEGWKSGMYVVQVRQGNKTVTRKLIKSE